MSNNKLLLALQRLEKNDMNGVPLTEKRDVLGVVAGIMVAMRLALPTTPVTEPVNYYVSTHESIATKMFDQVNTELFINTNLAIEMARNIYLMRYRMLYDDQVVLGLLRLLEGNQGLINIPTAVNVAYGKVAPEVLAKAAEYYF